MVIEKMVLQKLAKSIGWVWVCSRYLMLDPDQTHTWVPVWVSKPMLCTTDMCLVILPFHPLVTLFGSGDSSSCLDSSMNPSCCVSFPSGQQPRLCVNGNYYLHAPVTQPSVGLVPCLPVASLAILLFLEGKEENVTKIL